MAVHTSDDIPHLTLAATDFKHHFGMCVMGHTFGGCNCSFAVASLVSMLVLCLNKWRIGWSMRHSAPFGSNFTLLRCFWSHYMLLWIGDEDDNERSDTAWGLYRYLQLTIQWQTANLHVLCKVNPTGCSCRKKGIWRVLRFVVSMSNVVYSYTGTYHGQWQLKYQVW